MGWLSTAAVRPICLVVNEEIWTFARDGQQLEIRRSPHEEGFLLGITGDGAPRSYLFDDLDRLQVFQSDFEKFLLGTGWAFLGYYPDRRTGRERRHFSRLISDRRRWWTDGLKAPFRRAAEGWSRNRGQR